MANASRSAGVMVGMGSYLTSVGAIDDLKKVVVMVESRMDTSCHRLVLSYSWLMLSTMKVHLNVFTYSMRHGVSRPSYLGAQEKRSLIIFQLLVYCS